MPNPCPAPLREPSCLTHSSAVHFRERAKSQALQDSLTQFFLFWNEIICLTKAKMFIVGWNNFVIWITGFFSHLDRKDFIKIFIMPKMWTNTAVGSWIDIMLYYGYGESILCNTQSTIYIVEGCGALRETEWSLFKCEQMVREQQSFLWAVSRGS